MKKGLDLLFVLFLLFNILLINLVSSYNDIPLDLSEFPFIGCTLDKSLSDEIVFGVPRTFIFNCEVNNCLDDDIPNAFIDRDGSKFYWGSVVYCNLNNQTKPARVSIEYHNFSTDLSQTPAFVTLEMDSHYYRTMLSLPIENEVTDYDNPYLDFIFNTGTNEFTLIGENGELLNVLVLDAQYNIYTNQSQDFQTGGGLLFWFYPEKQKSYEERLSALETWKETLTDTITDILATLASLTNSINNHEARIQALESSSSGGGGGGSLNETFPDYLGYLSSSDRKAILCGYAEDNHLYNITDLGYNCTLTYRQTSRGETASCRCRA